MELFYQGKSIVILAINLMKAPKEKELEKQVTIQFSRRVATLNTVLSCKTCESPHQDKINKKPQTKQNKNLILFGMQVCP